MTNTSLFRSLTLAALVAASGAPAFAQDIFAADAPISVRVSYGDLNIHSVTGAAVLKARLQRAAIEACGGEVDFRDLGRMSEASRCRATAVSGAVEQMDAATEAALRGHSVTTLASR